MIRRQAKKNGHKLLLPSYRKILLLIINNSERVRSERKQTTNRFHSAWARCVCLRERLFFMRNIFLFTHTHTQWLLLLSSCELESSRRSTTHTERTIYVLLFHQSKFIYFHFFRLFPYVLRLVRVCAPSLPEQYCGDVRRASSSSSSCGRAPSSSFFLHIVWQRVE